MQNLTYMSYIPHPIYVRSSITEKKTQDLLDVLSKNLIGKGHFRTQMLMKKLIFLIELFLIFFIPHETYMYAMTKIHPGSTIE